MTLNHCSQAGDLEVFGRLAATNAETILSHGCPSPGACAPSTDQDRIRPARTRWGLRLAVACAVLTVGLGAAAAPDIKTERVKFAKGKSSATVQGRIKGYQVVDYLVGAGKGQTATVNLETKSSATYFNIIAPGHTDEAIFIGSTSGKRYEGVLPDKGDYRIRVYMMRSAARRNEVANYRLEIAVAPTSTSAAPSASVDAKVPGTPFHATGQVPCTIGTESKICSFGVIRSGPGHAEVHLTSPGGLERTLKFSGDQATAPGSRSIKAAKQGDEWDVQVNDVEHYRIPEAVINGG